MIKYHHLGHWILDWNPFRVISSGVLSFCDHWAWDSSAVHVHGANMCKPSSAILTQEQEDELLRTESEEFLDEEENEEDKVEDGFYITVVVLDDSEVIHVKADETEEGSKQGESIPAGC